MTISKDEVSQVFIKWQCGEDTLLSLMLSASGGLSRMGNGSGEKDHNKLCMGHSDEGLLSQWMEAFDPSWFELAGRYTLPDQEGKTCVLSLSFSGEKLDTGFEFTYGMDGTGPPEEIVELVDFALKLTDEWYESKLKHQN